MRTDEKAGVGNVMDADSFWCDGPEARRDKVFHARRLFSQRKAVAGRAFLGLS